ncbi:MAG TPA: DUF3710 domain-containing protein [Kineosporiaceae bacterium]|nr:DUF3710 domain-containing protein [Kineosporiaceae bacterium]
MSVFRRRRRDDDAAERSEDEAPQETSPEDGDVPPGLSPRPDGPWDSAERPTPESSIDLGGLVLPGRDGMELRLEVDEATGAVNGVAVVLGGSAVLLHAYAAPRREGIWADIRSEIAAGVTRQGGTADEVEGSFGPELLVRIPVRTPDGRTGHQVQRFAGVDGPRWFLRAVYQGPAAQDRRAAGELESVVRDVVVVRGAEAMAPRELLPLRLPDAAPATEPEPEGRPPLDPFTRGPEITEIR